MRTAAIRPIVSANVQRAGFGFVDDNSRQRQYHERRVRPGAVSEWLAAAHVAAAHQPTMEFPIRRSSRSPWPPSAIGDIRPPAPLDQEKIGYFAAMARGGQAVTTVGEIDRAGPRAAAGDSRRQRRDEAENGATASDVALVRFCAPEAPGSSHAGRRTPARIIVGVEPASSPVFKTIGCSGRRP